MNAASLRSWLPLVLAVAWTVLLRVPLVLNAENHLDSDLAVDGLTLAEFTRGHFRWHYPGTPAIGTPPVLASLPMALVWGANPRTLVSGGVVLYTLALCAIYLLNRRVYGPVAANWGLLPLTFASTGLIWLSSRITGGHWLVVAWGAAAFWLLDRALRRGGVFPALLLGLWCGLGLYVDRMFVLVLASLAAAVGLGRGATRIGATQYDAALAFVVGTILGWLPHLVGSWVDPHDAYGEQFVSVFRPIGENRAVFGLAWEQAGTLLVEHARILALECLPRLAAGHHLPGLETDPPVAVNAASGGAWTVAALAGLTGPLLVIGHLSLRDRVPSPGRTMTRGLALLSGAVVAGFLFNRNIFNSDNYRYLVLLCIPWSAGFGLMAKRLVARRGGRLAVGAAAIVFAGLATADAWMWYRGLGWMSGARPVVAPPRPDPAREWLAEHPEVNEIHGRYWDVYRLAFLADRPLRAWPWLDEPQRFGPLPERTAPDVTAVAVLTPEGRMTARQLESFRQHSSELLLWGPGRLTVYRWR